MDRLRTLIESRLGIELTSHQATELAVFCADRARTLSLTDADYLDRLRADPKEERRLWHRVTVGETYFLREEAHLAAALGHAIDRLEHRRPLEIWCAGCSTGEEPYSIALLAWERGFPVRIVGTDVDEHALERACEGIYGPWTCRRLNPERAARFTTAVDGKQLSLKEPLRRCTEFRYHNLMHSSSPQPSSGRKGWDLIFCRNVLIYFNVSSVNQTASRLLSALDVDGRLILGAAEPLRLFDFAEVEEYRGTITYRPAPRLKQALPGI